MKVRPPSSSRNGLGSTDAWLALVPGERTGDQVTDAADLDVRAPLQGAMISCRGVGRSPRRAARLGFEPQEGANPSGRPIGPGRPRPDQLGLDVPSVRMDPAPGCGRSDPHRCSRRAPSPHQFRQDCFARRLQDRPRSGASISSSLTGIFASALGQKPQGVAVGHADHPNPRSPPPPARAPDPQRARRAPGRATGLLRG